MGDHKPCPSLSWFVWVVSLAGCLPPGEIIYEGPATLADLGTVGSAVWVERDYTDDEGAQATWHYFVVTPERGLCEAAQAGYGGFEEATSGLGAAFSGQAQYDLWMDAYAALDEHLGPYYAAGSLVTRMFVVRLDEDEPTEGEQPVGGDQEAFFQIDLYEVDLFDAIADTFYVEDDSFRTPEYCYVFPEYCEGYSELYTTSNGTVDLSFEHDDTIRLEFDVELREGWDGEDVGSMVGHVDADHCVLPAI